jgi:hypothetical protein
MRKLFGHDVADRVSVLAGWVAAVAGGVVLSMLLAVPEAGADSMTGALPHHTHKDKKPSASDGGGRPSQKESTNKDVPVGSGTGFFVSADGYIITNFHVVDESTSLDVHVAGGKVYPARIVTTDPTNDVALIKIEAESVPLSIAATKRIKKGAQVFTLGYPLPDLEGREQKATFGRINALSGLQGDIRYFQMDVPIQPGNSGGPLISGDGFVIGITSAMLSQLHTLKTAGVIPQNVNYAVKSEYIRPLLAYAKVKNPAGKPIKDAINDPTQFENSVVFIVAKSGGHPQKDERDNAPQAGSHTAVEKRMVGIWEEYAPGVNVVQFYSDHTMKIYLTEEEGRDKDMHFIVAKWRISGDMILTLDIEANGKEFSESTKVSFKDGEMWFIQEKGPITKQRKISEVPEKYKW